MTSSRSRIFTALPDVIMNKTVLFTSVYFKGFAGSELATLELAKTFQELSRVSYYLYMNI
mgnify:CR=1 FL=1